MFNECLIHLCDCTCLNVLHLLNHMLSNTKRFLSVLIVFGKYFVLKIFKSYVTLFWRLCLSSQASRKTPVASLLKSFCDSLASQAPSHKKDLEKFQNFGFLGFSQLCLVTGSLVEAPIMRFT